MLEQPGGHVDAEAVDPAVQPEAQHAVEVGAHGGVTPVQIGLLGREHVEVPLTRTALRLLDPGPGGAAEHRPPVVGRQLTVLPASVGEVEERPCRAVRPVRQGGTEPRVLAGAVVGDDVQEHLQAQSVGIGHRAVELGEIAVHGVDLAVVRDVVAVVVLGEG